MSRTTIHIAYQMVKEDAHYDLCSVLLEELMINLKKIKQDKNNVFKYGSLVICLALYFLNHIPGIGRVQWAFDRPVAQQIKQGRDRLENRDNQNVALWAFFKTFQDKMKQRIRIPKEIANKYEGIICFMVDKDECLMEVVEPQMIWILLTGYKVEARTLDAYAQHPLNAPVDSKEERFGTYKEKSMELRTKFTEPERKRKVAKMVKEILMEEGHPRERVRDARDIEEKSKKPKTSLSPAKSKVTGSSPTLVKTPLAQFEPFGSSAKGKGTLRKNQKPQREYVAVALVASETESDAEILKAPKKG